MKLPNNKSERSPLGRRLGGETIRSKKGEGCSDDTDMAHRQEVLEEYVLKSAAVFPTARCQTIFLIVEYMYECAIRRHICVIRCDVISCEHMIYMNMMEGSRPSVRETELANFNFKPGY